MLSRTIKAMRRRVGPVSLSVAAAALTAVAFAAVSVAQDDGNKGKTDEDERGAFFEHHVGPPGGPPELSAEDKKAMEEFRSCMEENGADLPEPPDPSDFEDGERPKPPEPPSEADREAIEKALEACEDKLPEGAAFGIGPGGPGGPCGPPPGAKKGNDTAIPVPPPPGAGSRSESGQQGATS